MTKVIRSRYNVTLDKETQRRLQREIRRRKDAKEAVRSIDHYLLVALTRQLDKDEKRIGTFEKEESDGSTESEKAGA